jgi:N-acetyl-anhydromuramyl-L-alanine amidase AmpD
MEIKDIIAAALPTNQYIAEETVKTQIVLHHTASGPGVEGDINFWKTDPKRIATSFVVGRDGKIYFCFDSKYWAYHLGVSAHQVLLEQKSIGIEIDSWGGLNKVGGKYMSWANKEVPKENVVEYLVPFRGFHYFEKYTEAQIQSVKVLIDHLTAKHNIPKTFDYNIFDKSLKALRGDPGIFTHASYRTDKSDCHPQKELVAMLNSLH